MGHLLPLLKMGQPAGEEDVSATPIDEDGSRLCQKSAILKQDDFGSSLGRAAVLRINGHHTALARAQVKHAVSKLDGEITAPDDDGLCRVAMTAPLPLTAAGDPYQADGDTSALGGFLGAAGGLEARKGLGEIDHGHDVSL